VVIIARLHSKKKGKSGTKRQKSKVVPEWSKTKKAQLKELILKMSKEGIPPSKIGLALRDQHGVPNVRAVLGMRIADFLRSEGALPELPEDLMNLIRKVVRMQEHHKAVKNDTHNRVKMSHVESKIARLVKYYSGRGMIPAGWKYERDKVALLVK
jgi:small subunit ribosomal protein S15